MKNGNITRIGQQLSLPSILHAKEQRAESATLSISDATKIIGQSNKALFHPYFPQKFDSKSWIGKNRKLFEKRGTSLFLNKEGYISAICSSEYHFKKILEIDELQFVQSLDLSSCRIDADGAHLLSQCENLNNLLMLDLWRNSIEPEGASALANCRNLRNLVWLNLLGNHLRDEGLIVLARSKNLSNLKTLILAENGIGREGAIALAKSETFGNLCELDLWGNHIGSKGGIALAQSDKLTSLSDLNLWGNNIGFEGAMAFAQNSNLKGLKKLKLGLNNICDNGAVAIANSKKLRGLEELDLRENSLRDVTVTLLFESENSPNLTELKLMRSGETASSFVDQVYQMMMMSINGVDPHRNIFGHGGTKAQKLWKVLRDLRVGTKSAISEFSFFFKSLKSVEIEQAMNSIMARYPKNPMLITAFLLIPSAKSGEIKERSLLFLKQLIGDESFVQWFLKIISNHDKDEIMQRFIRRFFEYYAGIHPRNMEELNKYIEKDTELTFLSILLGTIYENGEPVGFVDRKKLISIDKFNEQLKQLEKNLNNSQREMEEILFQ
ncbi:MAG: hypothetical protein ABIE74_05340 [Pseudomonadota bacterium]